MKIDSHRTKINLTINSAARFVGFIIFLFLISSLTSSCNKKGYEARYGPFYVSNDTLVIMNGNMGSRIDNQFEKMIKKYPNIKLIILEECPGSNDDDEMFKVGRRITELGINTHLRSNSVIEFGAVDLFISGVVRTKEIGAKIGVHAWSSGKNDATDYPVGDEEHQVYIDYYMAIGFSYQQAIDFYYFTITAATPDEMYFLTEQDVVDLNILTP